MITPAAMSRDAYLLYGDLISARADVAPVAANLGTAQRFNWLGELSNLRPDGARANLCLFRSQPFPAAEFPVRLLERHPFSTQVFIPINCSRHYLIVVALGGDAGPDLLTLRAFLVGREQGITYRPGVWHHPLIALDRETDFACVVWEDESRGDCEVRKLGETIAIALSGRERF